MAIGDDAVAAGMDIVLGTEDRRNGYEEINKSRDYIANLTAADVGAAETIHWHSALVDTPAGANYISWAGTQWLCNSHIGFTNIVEMSLNLHVTGHVYVPNSTAAGTSPVAAYINGDGRLCRGVSSRRYKTDIEPIDPATIGGLFDTPFSEYSMKDGDGSRMLGYIAEDMAETGADRFVVRIDNRIESIDFTQLLLAQVANLNARLEALEASNG